jgi:hypothetical protein
MNSNDRPPARQASRRLRYVWRLAMPFWIFRDAGHGTVEQRVANYRYNRAQRKVLPFYVGKWIGIAACLMQVMRILSEWMSNAREAGTDHACAAFFCMSAGIGFAFSCVVIAVLFANYLFLCCVER